MASHARFAKRAESFPGGDNNLAVILGTFHPQTQCRGNFIDISSCQAILADMPASTDNIIFGPTGAPGVQEALPQEVVSGQSLVSD
jgi:hypothetical protein